MAGLRLILIFVLINVFFHAHGQLPCEDCPIVTADPSHQSLTEVGPCFDVEFEYNFSSTEGVVPASCIDGPICIKIKLAPPCTENSSFFNMAMQQIEVSLEGANSLYRNYQPSYDATDFCFTVDSLLLDPSSEGYAFSQKPKLTVNIGGITFEADINILPTGSYILGDLVATGIVEGPTDYSYFGLRICEGQNAPTIASGSTIEINGSNWTFNGNINGGVSSGPLSGSIGVGANYNSGSTNESYSILASVPLPSISSEDCVGLDEACKCCGEYLIGFSGLYDEYEVVSYGCDGEPNGEEQDNVLVLSEYLSAEYELEIQGCNSAKTKLRPQKTFGGNLTASTTGSIIIDEALDFDIYTLTWTGPNGFTATNETTLTNLPFGTYCYTLTQCGCDGPVDQGCVALCPDSAPVSDWYYDENQALYCRDMSCGETGGTVQECVDGVPCSDWIYDEGNESCFQDICYEGETLLINGVPPQYVSYQYNEHSQKCETIVLCEEGGEELTLEKDPEYSEPFFDEYEGTCLRYVICNGEEINTEDVGINDIEWSYDDFSGCVGTVTCNEGYGYEGEVSGYDVLTDFGDWEYDIFYGCFRDVICSYGYDFEETLYEEASGNSYVDTEYDDFSDRCYLDVSCDGEYVNTEAEFPSDFGSWDVEEALYNFTCVRSVTCSDGSTFEDFGDHNIFYTTSGCYEVGTDSNGDPIMMQKCYTVVNCNGETVVGEGDEEHEIPCGAPCPGGLYGVGPSLGLFDSKQARQERALARQTSCGVTYTLQNNNRQRRLSINASAAPSAVKRLAVIELSTGRVLRHFPLDGLHGQEQALLQVNLPNTGIYVLSVYKKDGSVCASKVFAP